MKNAARVMLISVTAIFLMGTVGGGCPTSGRVVTGDWNLLIYENCFGDPFPQIAMNLRNDGRGSLDPGPADPENFIPGYSTLSWTEGSFLFTEIVIEAGRTNLLSMAGSFFTDPDVSSEEFMSGTYSANFSTNDGCWVATRD